MNDFRHAVRLLRRDQGLSPSLVTIFLCIAAAACSSSTSHSTEPASRVATVPATLHVVHEAPASQWSAYETQGDGRTVPVFVMHDLQPKPVVFLLQGSGCSPAFTVEAGGRLDTTSLFQDVLERDTSRVHFAIVEKPGVAPVRFTPTMTHDQQLQAFERAGTECTPEFYKNATKPVRVADVLNAISAVSAQPWARSVIIVGHSEGTHVATGVLSRVRPGTVAGAALFASAGPVQFWSGSVSAGETTRESFQSAFDRMRMLQNAPDDFMYKGLPARRYKTFWLDSTPIEDVRDSDVPLFVAQGTRDGTVMASDLFAMEALRQRPKRPLRYVVVEGGDHGFGMPDGTSRVVALFDDFMNWVLDPKRSTGTAVIR